MPIYITPDFTSTNPKTIPYERFKFPGGEVQVKLQEPRDDYEEVTIVANISNSDAILELLMLTDACRRYGYEKIGLFLPYVPYSRQDRVCNPGEALSLKVFADLINAQKYEAVWTLVNHSDVATAVIDNCYDVRLDQLHYYLKAILKPNTILIAPDMGAVKRTEKLAEKLKLDYRVCTKKRDLQTGALSAPMVYSANVGDADLLIVDDLCDGGGTFLALVPELRKITTGTVRLFTAHGIYSKGTEILTSAFDDVYYINRIGSQAQPLLNLEVKSLINKEII